MPKTTDELAQELQVSDRQVLNYKQAVESHLGKPITFRQGKRHFYHDRYLPLIYLYAKGQPLPQVEEEENTALENPFSLEEENTDRAGAIVLSTTRLPAPVAVEAIPVQIQAVDTTAIEEVTQENWNRVESFKNHIRSQVLAEAESFGAELAAEIKLVVSRKVARSYREVIK